MKTQINLSCCFVIVFLAFALQVQAQKTGDPASVRISGESLSTFTDASAFKAYLSKGNTLAELEAEIQREGGAKAALNKLMTSKASSDADRVKKLAKIKLLTASEGELTSMGVSAAKAKTYSSSGAASSMAPGFSYIAYSTCYFSALAADASSAGSNYADCYCHCVHMNGNNPRSCDKGCL